MTNTSRLPPRRESGYRFVTAFLLALAIVAGGASSRGRLDGTVSAQALNPCALLMPNEIQTLTMQSVSDGVPYSFQASGWFACRYTWGAGTGRFKLDVSVNEPSRMFPGMSPDQIKQRLVESVRAGTADAIIPEIGDAAVFKPDSSVYASATALVKGHIVGVHLDGFDAGDKKDQLAGLLKSAASRL
jgi:hypothetical protein